MRVQGKNETESGFWFSGLGTSYMYTEIERNSSSSGLYLLQKNMLHKVCKYLNVIRLHSNITTTSQPSSNTRPICPYFHRVALYFLYVNWYVKASGTACFLANNNIPYVLKIHP